MKKIEITLQVESEGFVIENIEPDFSGSKLLMSLKNKGIKNE